MWPSVRLSVVLLAAPATVFACEGECIVGITKSFLGNYTAPINSVFQDISRQIAEKLLPQHQGDAMSLLQPIITAYSKSSYDKMETAIFPSYFHGKCQVNGVDPEGCPNPDCPVVCGTPGSLVHFYSKLRYIVFNETQSTLAQLASGGEAYQQTERAVMQAAGPQTRGVIPRVARYSVDAADIMGQNMPYVKKREASVKKGLREIFKQVPALLEKACGGSPNDGANALPGCSWEPEMKRYILSFP